MKEKITVKDFIDKLEEYFSIEEALEDIVVCQYVPFAEKVNAARIGIIKYNLQSDDVISNTPMTYLCYIVTVLRLYTSLDISASETDKDYDLLQENNMLEPIFKAIGNDLNEFQTIYDMCKDDFRANYLSAPAFAQKQINKIVGVCEKGIVKFIDWLDTLDIDTLSETIMQQMNKKQ